MRSFKLLIIFVIIGVLSFGAICGGKKEPTLTPPKPVEEPEEEVEIETPPVEEIAEFEVEEEPEPLEFPNINFEFNKYNLKPEARAVLREMADSLRSRQDTMLRIEGHCDERGTEQYNLALGEKRALEAKKFLVSAGIDSDRIDIISYGEERPVDPRHNEEAWAKNRRDEFIFIE